eukprot:scaffold1390_cov138-Cylindrotheca_fusiformis.AAC.58
MEFLPADTVVFETCLECIGVRDGIVNSDLVDFRATGNTSPEAKAFRGEAIVLFRGEAIVLFRMCHVCQHGNSVLVLIELVITLLMGLETCMEHIRKRTWIVIGPARLERPIKEKESCGSKCVAYVIISAQEASRTDIRLKR